MSEDRTQAPSKRRREQARARGMVARSGDLTAAAGVLAAVLLLGVWGGALESGLVGLVRGALESASMVATEPDGTAERLGGLLLAVVWPLAGILGGTLVAMVLTHVLQTGGLWAPALLAPDVERLWSGSRAGWGRGVFGLLKVVVLVGAAVAMLRADWPAMERLSRLETPVMMGASGSLARGFGSTVGLALLGLGVLDFVSQYRRQEARLRMTDQEHREERKSEDGDPAIKARRVRLARSWLRDPAEALRGTVVVLTAPGGLAVAVGGEPPPRRVLVRQVARGAAGSALRRAAERAGVPRVEAAEVARRLARGASAGGTLSADLGAALARVWPRTEAGDSSETASQ